ncbi:hypothetical protein LC085_00555 [Bacillus tianshenii]|uniref:hypothetical protein n=1 Tax=Sutcliffiella tianshenii TaxID=1463404 RepID=UPI001CD80936|nr:hypothetical protein [Bacillus tianshenii]MCA1318384.1 hypothetical protein [Bacillus tianshenii]
MYEMKTVVKKKKFHYKGSVESGLEIYFGKELKSKVEVNSFQLENLLDYYKNTIAVIGTSRTTPPQGSIGSWLINNVTKQAIASYIIPILIKEGYVRLVDNSKVEFIGSKTNGIKLS